MTNQTALEMLEKLRAELQGHVANGRYHCTECRLLMMKQALAMEPIIDNLREEQAATAPKELHFSEIGWQHYETEPSNGDTWDVHVVMDENVQQALMLATSVFYNSEYGIQLRERFPIGSTVKITVGHVKEQK